MTATGRYILFYDGDTRLKYRSEAVKLLIENLKPDGLMYMLLKIAPRAVSDFIYSIIAKLRSFLPATVCRIYSSEEKEMFLNERDFLNFISF